MCLAYLLAQSQAELVGITTFSGQAVARARLCSAQCKAAGKDIPIYPGADNPLQIQQMQVDVPRPAGGGHDVRREPVPV
jgi:purine nucleosidase